jgi:uncharacterized cupin superfamily protein
MTLAAAAAVAKLHTDMALEHEAVPDEQRVTGSPTTALLPLGELDGHEYGIWEMTPGAASDTEDDEVFVVLAGRATIEFLSDGSFLLLGPGDVIRLQTGARTVWTVTETLRKLYFA